MLVLTRRPNEAIVIEGGIRITVLTTKGDKVRFGIEAPETVRVDRAEVLERRGELTGAPILLEGCPPRC